MKTAIRTAAAVVVPVFPFAMATRAAQGTDAGKLSHAPITRYRSERS